LADFHWNPKVLYRLLSFQGDQIGLIFVHGAIVYFGQSFENDTFSANVFLAIFSTVPVNFDIKLLGFILVDFSTNSSFCQKKTRQASFWATFSQTHHFVKKTAEHHFGRLFHKLIILSLKTAGHHFGRPFHKLIILTKKWLGIILGDFFTNSSFCH
jgi:hypothetical protein